MYCMKRVNVGNLVVVRVKRDNRKMYSKEVEMILVVGVLREQYPFLNYWQLEW